MRITIAGFVGYYTVQHFGVEGVMAVGFYFGIYIVVSLLLEMAWTLVGKLKQKSD